MGAVFVPNGLLVVAVACSLLVVVTLIFFLTAFWPWLMAFMAGTPVPVEAIIGMKLRRIPADTIIRYLIMAKQGGVDVSCRDMERAYLQGVDLEKVTLAAIKAAREQKELTFADLVAAELEDRLAAKLRGL